MLEVIRYFVAGSRQLVHFHDYIAYLFMSILRIFVFLPCWKYDILCYNNIYILFITNLTFRQFKLIPEKNE